MIFVLIFIFYFLRKIVFLCGNTDLNFVLLENIMMFYINFEDVPMWTILVLIAFQKMNGEIAKMIFKRTFRPWYGVLRRKFRVWHIPRYIFSIFFFTLVKLLKDLDVWVSRQTRSISQPTCLQNKPVTYLWTFGSMNHFKKGLVYGSWLFHVRN